MLLTHNINVFNDLEETLKHNNCCCVIMGTGVGKTYVTLEYLKKYNLKPLVVAPRISILDSWEKHGYDTITYQKLSHIYKDIDFSAYDIIVCDEVHHIGAPTWGVPIKYLIDNNIIKVIGLTESSIRYTDGGKDVAKDYFYDNVAYGESVPSAIEKKILNPVTYVGAMYNSDGLKKTLRGKIQSRLYAKLNLALNKTPKVTDILKKHMPKGKRKGIIFASTIEDIKSAIDFVKSVYPNAEIKFVHSKQSQSYNDEAFDWFKNTDEGYICSVDMISEGVHIKGVNTLIMLRRTESVNLFNQQLGRCLDANSKESAILFDLVNNKYSIHIINDKLKIKTNSIFGSKRLNVVPSEQLIIKDYTKDIVEVLKEIRESLAKRWTEEEDNLLRQFYAEHPDGIGLKKFIQSNLPDRTVPAVSNRASYLGLCKFNAKPYTEEEINLLKQYYPTEGPACYIRFNNRSKEGIVKKANELKIQHNRFWTDAEIEILCKYYPTEGTKVLKRLPGKIIRQIKDAAIRYNISRLSINWTEEEDKLLQEMYSKIKGKKIQELFPNRTFASIQARATLLGLSKNYPKVLCVETGQIFKNAYEAARQMNLSVTSAGAGIDRVCRGKRITAYGYHWKYVKEE